MSLRDLRCVLGQDKYQIDRIGAGDSALFDFVRGIGLSWPVFRSAFKNRFKAWRILKLFVGIGVLTCLERRNGVVGAKLSPHLREDYCVISLSPQV